VFDAANYAFEPRAELARQPGSSAQETAVARA
jgi:hypothetical protein